MVKFKTSVNLTSTGKASVGFEIEECEDVEKYLELHNKLEQICLRKYAFLNNEVGGNK